MLAAVNISLPAQSKLVTFPVLGKQQPLTNSNLIKTLRSAEYKNDFAKTRALLRIVAKKVVGRLKKDNFSLTEARFIETDLKSIIKEIAKTNSKNARQIADIPNAIGSVIDQKVSERLIKVDKNKSLVEKSSRLSLGELQQLLGLTLESYTTENGDVITEFFRAEVKDSPLSEIISSLDGHGLTLEESTKKLAENISGKLLVLHPGNRLNRREIRLPLITIDRLCDEYSFFN